MKLKNKIGAGLLAAVMALSLCVPAFAEEGKVNTVGGSGTTKVEMTAEAAAFSVTVPTSLAFKVNADGSVTVPNNVELVNNSTAAVKVTNIEMKNGTWKLVSFDTNFAKEKVDSKKLAITMTANGDTVTTANVAGDTQTFTYDAAKWTMDQKGATLPLTFAAKASAVSATTSSSETAASIIFTIGWDSAISES